MRALDIAVFMWIFMGALYVIGVVFGYVSVTQPSPLITSDDIQQIIVYHSSEAIAKVVGGLITAILAPLGVALIGARLLGLNVGSIAIFAITVGLGLALFGRALWYAISLGSLIETVLEQMTYHYIVLPASMVWLLNVVGWLISFIAIVEWWRGVGMRQMD